MAMTPVVFDNFQETSDFIPDIGALKLVRLDKPGPRLDVAYELFSRTFDPAVLDSKETYREMLSSDRSRLDDVPAICVAAYFEHEDREVFVGFLSSNLMWIGEEKRQLQLAIGNIATSTAFNRKGGWSVGTDLWRKAIEIAREESAKENANLAYSVAEAEASSLGFWKKCGYLRPKGLRYLQPPLEFDDGGKPVRAEVPESFLILPLAGQSDKEVDTNTLRQMMEAIYRNWCVKPSQREPSTRKAIGAEQYVMGGVFPRVCRSLPDDESVELVAAFEVTDYPPVGVFPQSAVVFHFVYCPDPLVSRSKSENATFEPDAQLDSIERDLLACGYRYRNRRPFQSRVIRIPKCFTRVSVTFPKNVVYDAEGHILAHANRKVHSCKLAAFATTFRRNNISVLSVALTPDDASHDSFDEIDIISLAKLWEGGEGVEEKDAFDLHRQIRISPIAGSEKFSIKELADKLRADSKSPSSENASEGPPKTKKWLAGGTIQIVAPQTRDPDGRIADWNWEAFDHTLPGVHDKDRYIQMALKGMATGLFDIGHDHVDTQELRDSLRRFKKMFDEPDSKEFAVANKATLLVFNKHCRLFEGFNDVVGANPYLWLPHVVAIYNEAVLRAAISKFDKVDAEKLKQTEDNYQEAQDFMRERLQTDRLLNVFHYEHEQVLSGQCSETRGLDGLHDTAKLRLDRVDGDLHDVRESRGRRFASVVELLGITLAVVALLGNYAQIKTLVHEAWHTYWALGLVLCLLAEGMMVLFATKPFLRKASGGSKEFMRLGVILIILLVFVFLWALAQFGERLPSNDDASKSTPHSRKMIKPQMTTNVSRRASEQHSKPWASFFARPAYCNQLKN